MQLRILCMELKLCRKVSICDVFANLREVFIDLSKFLYEVPCVCTLSESLYSGKTHITTPLLFTSPSASL